MLPSKSHEDVPMNIPVIEETEPASEARQLLLDTLDDTWDKYRTKLKQGRAEFSEETVHDLRVVTRRLLALIQLLQSICPRSPLKKMRGAFKDQLDELDGLRDTQVILAAISKTLPELPQLQGFQEGLQSKEEKMLRRLPKKLKAFDTLRLGKRVRKTRDSIEDEPDDALKARLLLAVDGAYRRVRRRLAWVDASRAATIHRVRVAFKSLRYMIEIVHPLVGDFPTDNLKKMDEYQSLMGEVQDVEVLGQALAEFSESASVTDVDTLRRYFESRRTQAISAYLENMDWIDLFWRPAADQPFPWEKPALS